MNENYIVAPVVTDGGFGDVQPNLNNNFLYIKEAFDVIDEAVSTAIVFGTYTGDGQNSQNITITVGGKTYSPKAVEVYRSDGRQTVEYDGYNDYYGGFAISGSPCRITVSGTNYKIVEVTSTGFSVSNHSRINNRYTIRANENHAQYYYKAYINGTIV